jgi:hypothetical protein
MLTNRYRWLSARLKSAPSSQNRQRNRRLNGSRHWIRDRSSEQSHQSKSQQSCAPAVGHGADTLRIERSLAFIDMPDLGLARANRPQAERSVGAITSWRRSGANSRARRIFFTDPQMPVHDGAASRWLRLSPSRASGISRSDCRHPICRSSRAVQVQAEAGKMRGRRKIADFHVIFFVADETSRVGSLQNCSYLMNGRKPDT